MRQITFPPKFSLCIALFTASLFSTKVIAQTSGLQFDSNVDNTTGNSTTVTNQAITFQNTTNNPAGNAFTAILNNTKADLKWAAPSESNLSHFVIEKSTDGKDFKAACVVFAFENTSEAMNYNFSDKKINLSQTGAIYYRLRSVDKDGKTELSETKIIRVEKQTSSL
jgi:hypothetical protein